MPCWCVLKHFQCCIPLFCSKSYRRSTKEWYVLIVNSCVRLVEWYRNVACQLFVNDRWKKHNAINNWKVTSVYTGINFYIDYINNSSHLVTICDCTTLRGYIADATSCDSRSFENFDDVLSLASARWLSVGTLSLHRAGNWDAQVRCCTHGALILIKWTTWLVNVT
jgi:hypothetical protein